MSDDSGNGSFTIVFCDTSGCSLGTCRVSLTFLYSGSLATARRYRVSISKKSKRCKKYHITVNLRPAATSNSCDSWLGLRKGSVAEIARIRSSGVNLPPPRSVLVAIACETGGE